MRFRVGDKVKKKASMWKGLSSYHVLDNHPILTVKSTTEQHMDYPTIRFEETGSYAWDSSYFEPVETLGKETVYDTPSKESIAKPVLEERKVGKIEMDLFDSGFPNAILEVAKVMTWAGQNKGYKPHDWVNLPNAENSFPAAASRHRVKGLIQKVSGIPVMERVDEESEIVHKAHEAFNVLAELELMLRKVIK